MTLIAVRACAFCEQAYAHAVLLAHSYSLRADLIFLPGSCRVERTAFLHHRGCESRAPAFFSRTHIRGTGKRERGESAQIPRQLQLLSPSQEPFCSSKSLLSTSFFSVYVGAGHGWPAEIRLLFFQNSRMRTAEKLP